jgi:hypothetical protein
VNAGLTDVGGAQFVALCQHPAPRGLADDLGQATETPHGLFELEITVGVCRLCAEPAEAETQPQLAQLMQQLVFRERPQDRGNPSAPQTKGCRAGFTQLVQLGELDWGAIEGRGDREPATVPKWLSK